ncbi:MAG: RNA polymerase sigma factor FliA, partial [Gammaproteobacteria bacterium]
MSSYSEIGSFNGDSANIDELMTRFAPLVKRIAYHMMGRLPSSIQLDDMVQA